MRKKNDKGKDRHMSCLRIFRIEVYAENSYQGVHNWIDINQKISPRPSFPKRGNTSLWQREVRRDFSIIV
jgi:hypothetical protein